MKNAMKKLLSLMLAVMLLLSVVPFQAFAADDGSDEAVSSEKIEMEAVESDSVDNAVVYALPAGLKSGDVAYVYYHVDSEICKEYKLTVGAPFPAAPNLAQITHSLGIAASNTADWKFQCWSWNPIAKVGDPADPADVVNFTGLQIGGPSTAEGGHLDVSVDAAGNTVGEMHVYAVFTAADKTQNVRLLPNGGRLPAGVKDTIAVEIGGTYPELPTPVRPGYEFLGWEVNENSVKRNLTDLATDRTVYTVANLTAQWERAKIMVTVDWYNMAAEVLDDTAWESFADAYKEMGIPAGSKLSTSDGTFPTTWEINQKALGGFTFKGWKFKQTGNEFKPDSTILTDAIIAANMDAAGVIEIVPKLQRTVKLIASNSTVKASVQNDTLLVEIGSKITGNLPEPYALDSGSTVTDATVFQKWCSTDGTTTIATLNQLRSNADRPDYYPSLSLPASCTAGHGTVHHFDAVFSDGLKIELHYKEYKGSTLVYEGKKDAIFPLSGSVDMIEFLRRNLGDISKYEDTVDKIECYGGLGWTNKLNLRPAGTSASMMGEDGGNIDIEDLNDGSDHYAIGYVLVDNGTDPNPNGYPTNNKKADKSNPKTGDIILAVVAVMVVSGAALAAVYYCTKKKRDEK